MKRIRRIAGALALVAGLLLVGSPSPAQAEPVLEMDVSVFFETLAPHGTWVTMEPFGWVWYPDEVDYAWRPYLVGQWVWVDGYGWTWVSGEPWGWAVYHYGRWFWTDEYGWLWVPGSVWAPAWVEFRYGGGWIGWTPIPPTPSWRLDVAVVDVQISYSVHTWTFVPMTTFAEVDVSRHAVPAVHVPRLSRVATNVARPTGDATRVQLTSLDVEQVERVRGKPLARRKLKEADAPVAESGARVEPDAVVIYRPHVAPKAPKEGPRAKPRPPVSDVEGWMKRRQEALERHLEAQKKAAEEAPTVEAPPGEAPPPTPPGADDAEKRREEARRLVEEEQKRLRALLERQRRRLEQGRQPPPPPPETPPGGDDASPGNDDDGKDDGDKGKDKDKDKDKDKGGKEKDE